MQVTDDDMASLRHMLGAIPGRYRKSTWGWRNYYLAARSGPDSDSMARLVAAGYAKRGRDAGECGIYYHATAAGGEAVGMSNAAIKRAFA